MGRKALHERSNSQNNELPVLRMRGGVSSKDDFDSSSVSKQQSTPVNTTPTKRRSTSSSSKPKTPTSISNSTTSFESLLPPVPPLQINKIPPLTIKKQDSRGSGSTSTGSVRPPSRVAGLEQFFHSPGQSSRPSIYIDTVSRHASSQSKLDREPETPIQSPIQSPVQSPHASISAVPLLKTPSPRPLPQQPKPILKRTNYIPPETVEDYQERRMSWVERTLEQRYNFSRMNGRSQTLRLVRTSEEMEARDALTEMTPTSSRPLQSVSPQQSLSSDPSMKQGIRKKSSFASILSRSDSKSRPGTSNGVNIPAWARYFYSKDEISLPEDDPVMTEKPGITRMPSAHLAPPKRSPGVPTVTNLNDPAEVASRWSYPHLERTYYPLSPVEQIKNRQLVLFCLGFIMPICWIIAALLPLPGPRPMWKAPVVSGGDIGPGGRRYSYRVDVEATMNCTWQEERIFLSHEYWRKVNRGMSAVGVVLTGAIIALAVLAVKLS